MSDVFLSSFFFVFYLFFTHPIKTADTVLIIQKNDYEVHDSSLSF